VNAASDVAVPNSVLELRFASCHIDLHQDFLMLLTYYGVVKRRNPRVCLNNKICRQVTRSIRVPTDDGFKSRPYRKVAVLFS
jgi:hypothetical protein